MFLVDRTGSPVFQHPDLAAYARGCGGFDAVLDPFFDLYLEGSLPVLAPFGSYVTCGLQRQFPARGGEDETPHSRPVLRALVLTLALPRNISIMTNCLGFTHDLQRAIAAFLEGELDVPIDSVVSGDKPGEFLSRTYCQPERFGKVAYRYS